MDKNCKLFICVIIIFLTKLCKDIQCQPHEGFSIEVNTRITVQEHCCVSIPCSFKAANNNSFTNSTGLWKNDYKIFASTRNSNIKGSKSNFNITGNPDKGDCTLTITDARREDSGTYYFRFEGPVKYSYKMEPIIVSITDVLYQSHFGYSIEVNTMITVQEHCCVSIPCSFKAEHKNAFQKATGFWKNNNEIVASTRNSNIKGSKSNFNIIGNPDNGDCTLTITDARKEDSGTYYFRFEGPVKYSYEMKPIMVTVTDQPKKPEAVITVDGGFVETNRSMLIKDGNLTLNCSAGGKRPTKVTWIKGNSEISSWSTITITPSEADTYVCLAWDENGFSEKQLQINTKVNSTRQEKTDLLCGKENNERIFDLLIGTVCGIAIVIFSILALKLVACQMFKHPKCAEKRIKRVRVRRGKSWYHHQICWGCREGLYDEGVPAEPIVEDNLNKSKVANSKPIIQIPEDADEYQDPNSIPDNEDNIHYSNIVFPGHPFRALSMQPETEYAVIIK